MNKKLILTLVAAVSFASTAALQQNFVTSAYEFDWTEQAIENYRRDILETLDKMCYFLEPTKKKYYDSESESDSDSESGIYSLLVCIKKLSKSKGFAEFYSSFNLVKKLISCFQDLIYEFESCKNSKILQNRFENIKFNLSDALTKINTTIKATKYFDKPNIPCFVCYMRENYKKYGLNPVKNKKDAALINRCRINRKEIKSYLSRIKKDINSIYSEFESKQNFNL